MTLDQWVSAEKGRAQALARELGLPNPDNPVLVYQWRSGVRSVPLERCVPIEVATGGAVTCEELRPDLVEHFAYLRTGAAPAQQQAA